MSDIQIKCDLCKENKGDIWCHSDGGIGTPLRYGFNLHVCNECYKSRREEVDTIQNESMKKNRKSCQESLKNKIWSNEPDRSGMVHFALQYWFQKLEWNDIKQYEEWLGFELSPSFKQWIETLKCFDCGKCIHKPTEEEAEEMAVGLPELGPKPDAFTEEEKKNPLWFDEDGKPTKLNVIEWQRRYKEYLKKEIDEWDDKARVWKKRFTILYTATKYLEECPKFPESLGHTPVNQLKGVPEYDEYNEHYKKYQDSKVEQHFCSESCLKKALDRDKDLVWTNY